MGLRVHLVSCTFLQKLHAHSHTHSQILHPYYIRTHIHTHTHMHTHYLSLIQTHSHISKQIPDSSGPHIAGINLGERVIIMTILNKRKYEQKQNCQSPQNYNPFLSRYIESSFY